MDRTGDAGEIERVNEPMTLSAPGAAARPPLLSVCIPTYNRAGFLRPLLARIAADTADLADLVEIIVADNASTDDTAAVCAEARLAPPLRVFRHEENIGGLSNYRFVISQARGKYCLYLADDDILFWPALLRALKRLEADRNALALYAPWYLVDLTEDAIEGQFFHIPGERVFGVGDRAAFAQFALQHQVFSEIAIFRTEVFRKIDPVIDDTAFWAFTVPAELLSFGTIVYSPEPFYGSVTRHPGVDQRMQAGHEQVMSAWDSYRGGAEHLIGLARPKSEAERAALRSLADRLVQDRMLVALRLRIARGWDPVQTYYLASRLRGLGREAELPVDLDVLSLRAGVAYLGERVAPRFGAERLALIGFSPAEIAWIADASRLPVTPTEPAEKLDARDVALVAVNGAGPTVEDDVAGACFAIGLPELLAKFP